MANIARISISERATSGHGELIKEIFEFEVPSDPVKRRRMLMTKIGKIIDQSISDEPLTSMTVIFADIGSN